MPSNSAYRRSLAAEAWGTYALVLVGTGAVALDAATGGKLGAAGIALTFGAAVAVVILWVGPVSGAHINPAVTFAEWWEGKLSARHAGGYWTAQLVGATAASLTLALAVGRGGVLGTTVPAVPAWKAFLLEAGMTAFMVLAACVMRWFRRGPRATACAVGAAVALDAFFGGALTGASMNPARSFGPALVAGVWTAHWLYWAAPMLGALAGAHLYRTARA